MTIYPEDARQRLAAAVRARRDLLGLARTDLVARGGPSYKTVFHIEKGVQAGFATRTLRGIEKALGWPVGYTEHILTGSPDDLPPVVPELSLGLVCADCLNQPQPSPAVTLQAGTARCLRHARKFIGRYDPVLSVKVGDSAVWRRSDSGGARA